MRVARCILTIVLATAPGVALAQSAPELHLGYDTYAAGLHVADVSADFAMGQRDYQVKVAYHTTGFIGFLYRGHQFDTVTGVWDGAQPMPTQFYAIGVWGGEQRLTQIDYHAGAPKVVAMVPPNRQERQPVPPDLQANAVDSLSALALLMHRVADTGRCDASVRTYDGRRASELEARTIGDEMLPRTGRSIYSGRALRCDFTGRMLAGFKLDDEDPASRRPLHGSAWFAAAIPGGPPLPVRMQFDTRWFGEATMFLTEAHPGGTVSAQK